MQAELRATSARFRLAEATLVRLGVALMLEALRTVRRSRTFLGLPPELVAKVPIMKGGRPRREPERLKKRGRTR